MAAGERGCAGPQLLRAAFGFPSLEPCEPELRLMPGWLDTWTGIGHIVPGMACQDDDLELRRYDGRGWSATFFLSGFEHSLTADAGRAWARSPWEAVQRAAGDALRKRESPDPGGRGSYRGGAPAQNDRLNARGISGVAEQPD